ncbi:MAG TPA: hypothetical protein VJ875_13205 [Pyrinomonadaceae bacterium]|nr:hypothetical protein [Pyrinomonadaceae bacterium]
MYVPTVLIVCASRTDLPVVGMIKPEFVRALQNGGEGFVVSYGGPDAHPRTIRAS